MNESWFLHGSEDRDGSYYVGVSEQWTKRPGPVSMTNSTMGVNAFANTSADASVDALRADASWPARFIFTVEHDNVERAGVVATDASRASSASSGVQMGLSGRFTHTDTWIRQHLALHALAVVHYNGAIPGRLVNSDSFEHVPMALYIVERPAEM